VVGHVAAAVKAAPKPAPAIPVATLQNALAASYAVGSTQLQSIQTRDATILIPPGLVPGKTYPLVVAFAYNGNPGIPFEVWWTQAKQNHWIVYASKDFKNSVLTSGLASSNAVAARVKAQLDTVTSILPVDPSRIILTGMSGGANYAEFMNLRYPGYAAAIISNSGHSRDLLDAAEIAREKGATLIVITASDSPLAQMARAANQILLAADHPEDYDRYSPMVSRLLHLIVIDILTTAVALRLPGELRPLLQEIKKNLRAKRYARAE